jgi:hypothetical protein
MAGPTVATIKRLFAVSGNRCAFPGCELPLVDEASGNVLGEICHIKAKRPDGPRYDPEQTEEERHGFGNLVLLCPTHHAIVDGDAGKYTVEKLLRIKAEHEARHAGGAEPSDEVARRWLPPFTAPPDLATFTGRVELLEELDGLLEPGGTRAVAIVGLKGMAGVGKSALAVHAAHLWRERFPDGVAWVDLRAERRMCARVRSRMR